MNTSKTKNKKMNTYNMVVTALFAALMCILGPNSIPIGAVPISFTNLVIYLAVMLIGTKYGTISYGIYFLLGLVGLPVFSGYTGGLQKIAGPTGGYLVGFFLLAIVSGLFIKKFPNNIPLIFIGMVLGTTLAYILGTIWFTKMMECTFYYALTVCVFPFIIGDVIKMIIAIIAGLAIRKRLIKGGFIE